MAVDLDIQSPSLLARTDKRLTIHQRSIEGVSAVIGRPSTLYATIAVVGRWIGGNTLLFFANPTYALDAPPFFWLQGVASLGGLLVTTIVLITQSRQARHADERVALDLEVNLCTELKISKLIALVEELRLDMPSVRNRVDLQANAMQTTLDPHAILTALEISKDGQDR